MNIIESIDIIQPDDWHTHLREGNLLNLVSKYTARINNRCIAMPNLEVPITSSKLAKNYLKEIKNSLLDLDLNVLIPCYLTDNLDTKDSRKSLVENIFIGAKLYPNKATTNSNFGVSDIEKIFPSLEILAKAFFPK